MKRIESWKTLINILWLWDFFVFIKMRLFGGLICFCSVSYSSRNHKGPAVGRAVIPACVGLVEAHLVLHLQGRNHAGRWAGPWAEGSWQSCEWGQGNASAAVFYPEGCAGTQCKQIQVLQREICASHEVGTQNLCQSPLQRSCLRKILTPKASTNTISKILSMRGLYSISL